MREIQASELERNCLTILDEVERTGEPVTILKGDRPVAQLLPVSGNLEYPQHKLFGTIIEPLPTR